MPTRRTAAPMAAFNRRECVNNTLFYNQLYILQHLLLNSIMNVNMISNKLNFHNISCKLSLFQDSTVTRRLIKVRAWAGETEVLVEVFLVHQDTVTNKSKYMKY